MKLKSAPTASERSTIPKSRTKLELQVGIRRQKFLKLLETWMRIYLGWLHQEVSIFTYKIYLDIMHVLHTETRLSGSVLNWWTARQQARLIMVAQKFREVNKKQKTSFCVMTIAFFLSIKVNLISKDQITSYMPPLSTRS